MAFVSAKIFLNFKSVYTHRKEGIMKRIFYRFEEDLYFDWDGFMVMVEGSGLNVRDLEDVPLVREGKTYSNTFNHLVHVN